MLKSLFLFLLLVLPTTYAFSLEDLKKQANVPLYFTVPIQSYEIVKKDNKINLKVQLSPYSITAMTDRPYRKKEDIKPHEFINYIKDKREKELVFTVSIQKDGQPFLVNFRKEKVVFSPDSNEVIFENIKIPEDVSDQIGDVKGFKGANAVLIVEG
jgi:hypothetical protein